MPDDAAPTPASRPLLSLDLSSPFAYLTVERIDGVLPSAAWETVALGAIFKATGRRSWGEPGAATRAGGQAEVQRRAEAYGLPPIHWPERWPSNGLQAARASLWAAGQGHERAYVREAMRLQFRDGIAIDEPAAVEEALRRAGLAAAAGLAATSDPAIKLALRERTDAALARGVFGVPSISVGPFVVWGDDHLQLAAQLAEGRR